MTTTLFALTNEALILQNQINATAEQLFCDDPQAIAVATEQLEQLITTEATNRKALEAKADAWCWVIDGIRAQAASQQAHAERLKALAEAASHRADTLQEQLIYALQRVNPDEKSWTLPGHKIVSRLSSRVEIDPDATLPEEYERTKTTVSPDKTALKAAIQAGKVIDGVSLVEHRSWSIK